MCTVPIGLNDRNTDWKASVNFSFYCSLFFSLPCLSTWLSILVIICYVLRASCFVSILKLSIGRYKHSLFYQVLFCCPESRMALRVKTIYFSQEKKTPADLEDHQGMTFVFQTTAKDSVSINRQTFLHTAPLFRSVNQWLRLQNLEIEPVSLHARTCTLKAHLCPNHLDQHLTSQSPLLSQADHLYHPKAE